MVPKPLIRLRLCGEAGGAPRLGAGSPGGPLLSSGPGMTGVGQGS